MDLLNISPHPVDAALHPVDASFVPPQRSDTWDSGTVLNTIITKTNTSHNENL